MLLESNNKQDNKAPENYSHIDSKLIEQDQILGKLPRSDSSTLRR